MRRSTLEWTWVTGNLNNLGETDDCRTGNGNDSASTASASSTSSSSPSSPPSCLLSSASAPSSSWLSTSVEESSSSGSCICSSSSSCSLPLVMSTSPSRSFTVVSLYPNAPLTTVQTFFNFSDRLCSSTSIFSFSSSSSSLKNHFPPQLPKRRLKIAAHLSTVSNAVFGSTAKIMMLLVISRIPSSSTSSGVNIFMAASSKSNECPVFRLMAAVRSVNISSFFHTLISHVTTHGRSARERWRNGVVKSSNTRWLSAPKSGFVSESLVMYEVDVEGANEDVGIGRFASCEELEAYWD
ncbi:hypothetical protein BT69DRAFT_1108503 [Atractiella rhizophila]|nr:hypothetical protein BT69DRAFT_1108503 [Atractiella rhizophila]